MCFLLVYLAVLLSRWNDGGLLKTQLWCQRHRNALQRQRALGWDVDSESAPDAQRWPSHIQPSCAHGRRHRNESGPSRCYRWHSSTGLLPVSVTFSFVGREVLVPNGRILLPETWRFHWTGSTDCHLATLDPSCFWINKQRRGYCWGQLTPMTQGTWGVVTPWEWGGVHLGYRRCLGVSLSAPMSCN